MSWTTIVDEDSRARYFENRLNEIVRHCKIGKVARKGLPSPIPFHPKPITDITPDFWKSWPFNGDARAPTPHYMSKCGCKVGTACGNVACPHRLVATC